MTGPQKTYLKHQTSGGIWKTRVHFISPTAGFNVRSRNSIIHSWTRQLRKIDESAGHQNIRNTGNIRLPNTQCMEYLKSLRIQVCPKKGINPTILLWGWDWDHQTYSREGYGSLGTMYIYTIYIYIYIYIYILYSYIPTFTPKKLSKNIGACVQHDQLTFFVSKRICEVISTWWLNHQPLWKKYAP